MVKLKVITVLILFGIVALSLTNQVHAQREYYFGQEWVKIWVEPDGSIDLFYNISITLDYGDNINWISVGQPNSDFTIGQAIDQNGNTLQTEDISTSNDYKVKVNLKSPLRAGETIWFTLLTNVGRMIFEDQTNPGNDGMQFTASWYTAPILDSRIVIVIPQGINEDEVKTGSVFWSNILYEEERLAVYWEKQNSIPDERFNVAVSYPKQQGWTSFPKTSDGGFLENIGFLLLIIVFFAAIIFFIFLIKRKQPYKKPTVAIESLGILRGLTAVEASYLLDLKPTKIVTEILYGLLKKRAVWVKSTTPSLEFTIQEPYLKKTGTNKYPLRYYEIDFLNAIKENGTLDEKKLANTIMFLRSTLEEKLKGYCRKDTINYYRKIVSKAWKQVETAGTSKLASKVYDEQLLWLFLDPEIQNRTQIAFKNYRFEPDPLWFWYWYSSGYYKTKIPNKAITKPPSATRKPTAIPGADFANNIASAIENSANNLVLNMEKFANAIIPLPPKQKTSRQPAHQKAKCVCACAACACACACVSCACACAGGGVG